MKNLFALVSVFLLSYTSLNNFNALSLIPGGENIAFEIYPNGIIITGTYDIKTDNKIYNPSIHSDIIKGDRIIEIGDYKVTDLNSFTSKINHFTNQNYCTITLVRNNKEYRRNLQLILENNVYKTGLYVKERLIGVGTVSYYDPITKSYGALAHEVYDSDSGSILEVRKGQTYLEDVESINKSENGKVGNKNSTLTFEDELGDIKSNTKFGIYGSIDEIPSSYTPIEVAEIDEIKLGKAEILTTVKGSKIERFSINITNLKKQEKPDIKGISFKITDKRLLDIAGGIYSGMSGSPIIQDNKLIGAVTHVNIDNVTTGFANYMKYMYEMSFC